MKNSYMGISQKIKEFSQLPPDRMLTQSLALLPGAVAAVLAVAIGWQMTRLVWIFAPYSAPETTTLKPLSRVPSRASLNSVNEAEIDRLVNAHLFGEISKQSEAEAPQAQEIDPTAAPDTTLSLELLGTIASELVEESYALIHERGKETKVFAIGDSVTRGTRLHGVYTDRVLLDRGGRLEALRLPKEEAGRANASASQSASRSRGSSRLSSPTVANVIADNVTKLTDVMRPQPVFADGQQRGYRLYPGKDRRTFAALGLRPGDLVTEINGTALNDPASGMEVFQSIGEATSVTVTIERNGQPEVLVLDTAVLAGQDEE
ncbi:MAG: type II secretion system protein GspC [Chromatiales bacterium]|nr:type II secretion system protein GspC [Chromatiales bacterium]